MSGGGKGKIREVKIFQVDAFTHLPFTGNPAAVVLLEGPADDGWMQKVSMEMNLSETAFLYRESESFHLRWFTPRVEVDLCGHATLASAHILWEEGLLSPNDQARFLTKSGLLTAERKGDWIELNFPSDEIQEPVSARDAEIIEKAIKVKPLFIIRTRFDFMVEVGSEEVVKGLNPEMELFQKLPGRGVVVTSRSASSGFDFVSRFFAPNVGINEDPVTGSAHCFLTPFWSNKLNKIDMIAHQISGRSGIIKVRQKGDRVFLAGQSVTILRGILNLV
jgi:PhzF family phenazine biosynthesis protein